jgi:phosphomannomutase
MIPWLLVASLICSTKQSLSQQVKARIEAFPCSGEINRKLVDPEGAIIAVQKNYKDQVLITDEIDGISMEFPNWRFNIRKSNTETLLRLNVESRNDKVLLAKKTAELLAIIEQY